MIIHTHTHTEWGMVIGVFYLVILMLQRCRDSWNPETNWLAKLAHPVSYRPVSDLVSKITKGSWHLGTTRMVVL